MIRTANIERRQRRHPSGRRGLVALPLAAAIVAAFLAVSCSAPSDPVPETVDEEPVTPRETIRDYAYGSDPLQTLDVWFPLDHDATRGAILLVHGGSWIGGSKTELGSDAYRLIANLGYVTVSMNYRLADPEASAESPSAVGYGDMLDDIDGALGAIAENADDWGCDPGRIALVGVSAGGYLALMETLTRNEAGTVKACASLSGPADLTDSAFREYIYESSDESVTTSVGDGIAAILGGAYDETDAESVSLWESWSPVHIAEGLGAEASELTGPEWYLAWGELDDFVPWQTQGLAMKETLVGKGSTVAFLSSATDGHDLENAAYWIVTLGVSGLCGRTIR